MGIKKRVICLLLLLLTSYCSFANDIRMVIDVSGSMKKTDPLNLRVPAVKVLSYLIPINSIAGIWIFSDRTHILMPKDIVNKSWQRNAAYLSQKIHSNGRYTNLYLALLRPSETWLKTKPNEKHRRILVLLSDGEIEISESKKRNEELREKIIFDLLPKLRKSKIHIYSIALSNRADKEILKEISISTGGYFQSVKNAEDLEKSFFNVFYAAVDSNMIPIEEDSFYIDKSIKEVTLLLQARPKKNFIIKKPDKTPLPLSENQIFATKYFTFITIPKPETGKWTIENLNAGSNLVLIYSDLALKTLPIDNNLFATETIYLDAFFSNKNQKIIDIHFLKMFKVKAHLNGLNKKILPLSKRTKSFATYVNIPQTKGNLVIKIVADGKILKRQVSLLTYIHPIPYDVAIKKGKEKWRLSITRNTKLTKEINYHFYVNSTIDTTKRHFATPFKNSGFFSFKPPCDKGYFTIMVNASGIKPSNHPFTLGQRFYMSKCPKGAPVLTSKLASLPQKLFATINPKKTSKIKSVLVSIPAYSTFKSKNKNLNSVLTKLPKMQLKTINNTLKKDRTKAPAKEGNLLNISPLMLGALITVSILVVGVLGLLIRMFIINRRKKLLNILEDDADDADGQDKSDD